jgi:hypothetical protein
MTSSGENPRRPPGAPERWLFAGITAGAGLFIVALAGSALVDPKIWGLHVVKAAIYVAVIVLIWRGSVWGLGAGFMVALAWNYANLYVHNYVHLLHELRISGDIQALLILVLLSAAGHFVMIACCLAAFLLRRPRRRQWAQFAGGAVLGICALVLIGPHGSYFEVRPLDVTNLRIWSSLGLLP